VLPHRIDHRPGLGVKHKSARLANQCGMTFTCDVSCLRHGGGGPLTAPSDLYPLSRTLSNRPTNSRDASILQAMRKQFRAAMAANFDLIGGSVAWVLDVSPLSVMNACEMH
jgi:hypothetical protein